MEEQLKRLNENYGRSQLSSVNNKAMQPQRFSEQSNQQKLDQLAQPSRETTQPNQSRAKRLQQNVASTDKWQAWEKRVSNDLYREINDSFNPKLQLKKAPEKPVENWQKATAVHVSPRANATGQSLFWKTLYDIVEMDRGAQQGLIAAFMFKPANITNMNGFKKVGYYVGETLGALGGLMTGSTEIDLSNKFGLLTKSVSITSLSKSRGSFSSSNIEKTTENIITSLKSLDLQLTHGMTMSKNAFKRLINDVKQNGVQEPIRYVEHERQTYVVDGNHRVVAARMLGIMELPVEKVELPYAGYKVPEDLNYYGPSNSGPKF